MLSPRVYIERGTGGIRIPAPSVPLSDDSRPEANPASRRKVLAIVLCIWIMTLIVGWMFSQQLGRVCVVLCKSIRKTCFIAYSEVAVVIELCFYGSAYFVAIKGLWSNVNSADHICFLCYVLPLEICTYFLGIPAVFLNLQMFYSTSKSFQATIFKTTFLVSISAFIWCYGQHITFWVNGMEYHAPRMDCIEMMPIAIFLPVLPVATALFEEYNRKLEAPARAQLPKQLALTL